MLNCVSAFADQNLLSPYSDLIIGATYGLLPVHRHRLPGHACGKLHCVQATARECTEEVFVDEESMK